MSEPDNQSINMNKSVFVGSGSKTGNIVNISGTETNIDAKELQSLLSQIKAALDEMPLPDESKSEVSAELKTVEAQLNSPNPKPKIITESLKTIRSIIESIIANAIYTGLTDLTALTAQLTRFIQSLG